MNLKQSLLQINQKINDHAKQFTQPYLTFAIFGIITYPLYYWIWRVAASQGYENLELRLITVFLCVLLALKDFWPEKWKKFFPLFWYITLLYSLPFLFTFLLLKNHMSYTFSMNVMTVLVLAILLLDLFSLFIILTLGIFFGIIAFLLTGGTLYLPKNYMVIFITYGSILFFGSVFSYRKDQLKEREKRIAAEAANQAKADFISNMEHDLRTPFSGIHGIASYLYESETDPLKTEYLKLMIESCTQWENIHNRILAALLNKKPQYLQKEMVSIERELTEIKNMMAATLHLKKLEFIIDIPKDFEKIETDKMKFNLILTNLISNAINFTEKGAIKIIISREGGICKIQVIDTGIGIPEDKLEYIFEQFTKLSRSNKYGSNFKGVGLGLYTARQHAKLIGATISVESKIGEGSLFTLSLPINIKNNGIKLSLPYQR